MIKGKKIVQRADVARDFFNATAVDLDEPIAIECDRRIGRLTKQHHHTTTVLVFSRGKVGVKTQNAIFALCSDHGHVLADFSLQVGDQSLQEALASVGVTLDASSKVH